MTKLIPAFLFKLGFREFNDLVNQLPEDDKPSMFGLPANIQQAYQRSRSSETLQHLRILMRSAEGASKFEREKWSVELSPIMSLWKKLNQSSSLIQFKLTGVGRASRGSAQKEPVAAFVDLEFSNAVKLIQVRNVSHFNHETSALTENRRHHNSIR